MKTIYIDQDYKCHIDNLEGRIAIETNFFDDKCNSFIEGYRYVPSSSTWLREDEEEFIGEMVSPWRPVEELQEAQRQYERERYSDMKDKMDIIKEVGITIEEKPLELPSRPGYIWIPRQKVAGGAITWTESSYDSTMPGTKETPIAFVENLTVLPNYYYILNGVRKLWAGNEATYNPSWDDENFIEF